MTESEAMQLLENDLNGRINPEKSRRFSEDHFLRMRETLRLLGENEEFRSSAVRISVVGTNGKGSVAWYLSKAAEAAKGEGSGLYTSPHLLHFSERIRINGKPLSGKEGLRVFQELESLTGPVLYQSFSFFEILTLAAVRHFRRSRCHTEIYEAGIGGRLDATGMVNADYAVLTSVGLDHTEILGNSFKEILYEKLGILTEKTKSLFVMLPCADGPHFMNEEDLKSEIRNYLEKKVYKTEVIYFPCGYSSGPQTYLERNARFADFIINNIYNSDSVYGAIINHPPPGRCEIRTEKNGSVRRRFIFDTAHNQQAADILLQELISARNVIPENSAVIVHLTGDRKPEAFLSVIEAYGFRIIKFFKECRPEEFRSFTESLPENITDVIFSGSHRTYFIFNQLTERSNHESQ